MQESVGKFFSRLGPAFMHWLKQVAVAVDQLVNALTPGGWADETISARCWRLRQRRGWNVARLVIDTILFFDPNHCEESYISEQKRTQCAPEYRTGNLAEK